MKDSNPVEEPRRSRMTVPLQSNRAKNIDKLQNILTVINYFAEQQASWQKTMSDLEGVSKTMAEAFKQFNNMKTPNLKTVAMPSPNALTYLAEQPAGWQRTVSDLEGVSKTMAEAFKQFNNMKTPNLKTVAMPSPNALTYLAEQPAGWQKLPDTTGSELFEPCIEDTKARAIDDIQYNLSEVSQPSKIEAIREWIIFVVTLAMFVVMLADTLPESDDAIITNIETVIINVWESCSQNLKS